MWNNCKKQKRKKNAKLKWELWHCKNERDWESQNYENGRKNAKVRIMRMGRRMLRWELWECKNEREWDQSCKPPSLLSQAMNQPGASFTPLPSWAWETSLWLADCPIHLTNQKTVLLISLYHRIRKDKNFPDSKIFTVSGLSRQFFVERCNITLLKKKKNFPDFCKNFRVFWLWVTTAGSKIRNAFLFFLSLVALHCTLSHPRWTWKLLSKWWTD